MVAEIASSISVRRFCSGGKRKAGADLSNKQGHTAMRTSDLILAGEIHTLGGVIFHRGVCTEDGAEHKIEHMRMYAGASRRHGLRAASKHQ